jgi:hypothetical protein
MDFSCIIQRLDKQFYRSQAAVVSDLELVVVNARIFNKPGTLECTFADKLCRVFPSIVSGDDWQAALRKVCSNAQRGGKDGAEEEQGGHGHSANWRSRARRGLQRFHKFHASRVAQLLRPVVEIDETFLQEVSTPVPQFPCVARAQVASVMHLESTCGMLRTSNDRTGLHREILNER